MCMGGKHALRSWPCPDWLPAEQYASSCPCSPAHCVRGTRPERPCRCMRGPEKQAYIQHKQCGCLPPPFWDAACSCLSVMHAGMQCLPSPSFFTFNHARVGRMQLFRLGTLVRWTSKAGAWIMQGANQSRVGSICPSIIQVDLISEGQVSKYVKDAKPKKRWEWEA